MANNNKKGNNYQSSISSRRSDKYKANNSSNSKANTRTSNSSNKNKEQVKHEYVNKVLVPISLRLIIVYLIHLVIAQEQILM